MNIRYRKFNESDSRFIKPLMSELGYSVSEKELISNINEILNRGGAVFIAEVDSRVVGCICSVIDARVAEGIYGELVSLVVSEKFRGAGVGKGLVRIGEKWIAERAKKIRVRANSIRSEAHVFYENLGYKETKSQKIFIKNV